MRSRHQRVGSGRGLLVLVLALAVGLVAIPAAQSTQGQPVIDGQTNDASSTTTLSSSAAGSKGVHGLGVAAGVVGESPGFGVQGLSDAGIGVYGFSNTGYGVKAHSGAATASLYADDSNPSAGVAIEGLNTAPNWVAIWGHHDPASFGYGVLGEAPTGVGVEGRGSAIGVQGSSASASGSGVTAENTAGGKALTVNGKASFSRSGVVTIPAGAISFTQTGVPLSSSSFILATMQTKAAPFVKVAVPNPAANSFTIYLNKVAPVGGVKVAYFIGD